MIDRDDYITFKYEPVTIFKAHGPWKYCREPIIRFMPNGDLVCLIYTGGPREPHNDNVELITRSTDGGRTWSEAEVLFDHTCRATWVSELFTAGERPFTLVHTFNAESHLMELNAFISFTDDNGHTWTEPVSMPGVPGGLSIRQGIKLENGTWCFPVYWQEQTGDWKYEATGGSVYKNIKWLFRTGCLLSDNQGQSYSLHGYVATDGLNLWEPNIVETAPGRLLMLMRAGKSGFLYKSESTDGGRTWSPAVQSDIPNPASKPTLLKHGSHILLLHNPNTHAEGRRDLALWVSSDGGKTWSKKLALASVDPDCDTMDDGVSEEDAKKKWITYPHGEINAEEKMLYVACDRKWQHYLLKIPFSDFM